MTNTLQVVINLKVTTIEEALEAYRAFQGEGITPVINTPPALPIATPTLIQAPPSGGSIQLQALKTKEKELRDEFTATTGQQRYRLTQDQKAFVDSLGTDSERIQARIQILEAVLNGEVTPLSITAPSSEELPDTPPPHDDEDSDPYQ